MRKEPGEAIVRLQRGVPIGQCTYNERHVLLRKETARAPGTSASTKEKGEDGLAVLFLSARIPNLEEMTR